MGAPYRWVASLVARALVGRDPVIPQIGNAPNQALVSHPEKSELQRYRVSLQRQQVSSTAAQRTGAIHSGAWRPHSRPSAPPSDRCVGRAETPPRPAKCCSPTEPGALFGHRVRSGLTVPEHRPSPHLNNQARRCKRATPRRFEASWRGPPPGRGTIVTDAPT
jgi:hypothetical protein